MKNFVKTIQENYQKALQFGGWGALGGAIGSLLAEFVGGDRDPSISFTALVITVGIWFGIIGGTIAIALLMGYSSYLKRGWRIGEAIKKGILPGLIAGFIAGAIAQFTYTSIGPTEVLRVICWGIAGGLLGFGLSFRIANLGKIRGFSGGGIGGIIGGILFIFISFILGQVMGRLLGISAIGFFIGVMIIIVEAAFRKAWLVVKWSANEEKTISLGSDPILLGYSDQSHIYLRQDQGYAPVTAKIYVDKNKILLQYDPEYGEKKGMKKLTQELNHGDKRKLGSVSLEVQTANS